MLLVIDVGNTNIHLGVYRGEGLQATWEVSNAASRTADELGFLLKSLLRDRGIDPATIAGAAVACVVPPVVDMVDEAVERTFGCKPLFIGPATDPQLLSLFDDPQEVGADRIANAVGGFSRYGGPLIVVDFGTATTFDAVSAEGNYLGGAIAPGIQISLEALFRSTAKLPRIKLERPKRTVGRNTAESMQAGIILGYAGLVETMVGRIRKEIGAEAVVVATGGLAALIGGETGTISTVDEHLTLEGLRILYGRRTSAGTPAQG